MNSIIDQGIKILLEQLKIFNLPTHPSIISFFKKFCIKDVSKLSFVNDIILRLYANAAIFKFFPTGRKKKDFYKKHTEIELFNKAYKEIEDFEDSEETITNNTQTIVCNLYSLKQNRDN